MDTPPPLPKQKIGINCLRLSLSVGFEVKLKVFDLELIL
jgi:hypothetical protein